MAIILLLFAITVLTISQVSTNDSKCSYINYRGKNDTYHHHKRNCSTHESCTRQLTLSYIDIPPYSTCRVFEKVVEGCCGKPCTNFSVARFYKNISEVELSQSTSSDFILPFLGSSSASELYGYLFIPFIDLPCAYYITHKQESRMTRMINNCIGLHPLIMFCLLAAVVSGFIIWAIETLAGKTGSNSVPFLDGLFEGFWWSFTSVTSGYGAKVIHSVPAKLYAVIWILIGVIMFSLMTGSFTAELMASMQPSSHSMTGATVGVLKYRDYDASLVVREGGIIKETEADNFYADILTLIHMLRTKEVNGVLLDKYTLAYTREYIEWKRNNTDPLVHPGEEESYAHRKEDIEYFLENTESTMKAYTGNKLAYGVLVKRSVDYLYFNNAVRDNRLSLETATESEMNQIFPRRKKDLFLEPPNDKHFGYLLRWVGGLVACICGFGAAHALYLKKQCRVYPVVDNAMSRLVDVVKGDTPM